MINNESILYIIYVCIYILLLSLSFIIIIIFILDVCVDHPLSSAQKIRPHLDVSRAKSQVQPDVGKILTNDGLPKINHGPRVKRNWYSVTHPTLEVGAPS
jgi:hypothetical protein